MFVLTEYLFSAILFFGRALRKSKQKIRSGLYANKIDAFLLTGNTYNLSLILKTSITRILIKH